MKPIGYDYGTKPTIMVLPDGRFSEYLGQGFTALVYGSLPYFGVLANPPLLAMAFNEVGLARDTFTIFKGWADASEDGDAVGVGFIEFDSGDYGMCIYPEHGRLVDRMISPVLRPEVEPILVLVGYLKMFHKRSEGYAWFKSTVKGSYFVLAPTTQTDGPFLDLAVRKREVKFYNEKEVPEHSMEGGLLRSRQAKGEGGLSRPIPPEMRPTVHETLERREKQLAHFFPVTLERLRFSTDFQAVKLELTAEGYREWQIIQGACNIVLRLRNPELFHVTDSQSGEQRGAEIAALEYLLTNSENVSWPYPPRDELSLDRLREQIQADSYTLLRRMTAPDSPNVSAERLQLELGKLGLLGE